MTYLSKGGILLDFFGQYNSPLGQLLLQSDGKNLTGVYLNRSLPAEISDLPVFDRATSWLDAYFRKDLLPEQPPILLRGTTFQKIIWNLLLGIPYGEIRTYGDLAKEAAAILGKEKMSAQAVGQAVGKNPVSILVPCHRCIGAKGHLTGYAGGMENKKWLLRHEGWQIAENRII